MYESVKAAFVPFNQPLEGVVPWMYVDQKNLVTTGMGNLIDPVGAAISLPWTHGVGGPPATQQEIQDAWNTVKGSGRAGSGGGNQSDLTDLRLSQDAIDALVAQKLGQFESTLASSYPYWSTQYADAQLAMLSMAWAMGPAFAHTYPSFTHAINGADYRTAALQSWMRDATNWVPTSLDEDPSLYPPNLNAGLRPRNLLNRQLFLNAASQQAANANPSVLVWSPGWFPSVGSSVAGHPILTGVGIVLVAGGVLALAQQAGLVAQISPKFDRQLMKMGKAVAAPLKGPGSEVDFWIRKATGGRLA